ncbi:hypothetical protein [Nonomuraea basaltis]|uniref:hypothetical protein n=1 Tax=Nonomuraea basaltis TaxID=2495887 RepID=UPI00110C4743|nr:hypothetical protein [Nonomuraea basaltis]TMR97511.1 hypothetical protein EJK15_17470 [Nonomuraea basaltis]
MGRRSFRDRQHRAAEKLAAATTDQERMAIHWDRIRLALAVLHARHATKAATARRKLAAQLKATADEIEAEIT